MYETEENIRPLSKKEEKYTDRLKKKKKKKEEEEDNNNSTNKKLWTASSSYNRTKLKFPKQKLHKNSDYYL